MELHILSYLVFSPLLGLLILFFIPRDEKELIKNIAFISSIIPLGLSLLLLFMFDKTNSGFQFETLVKWISTLNINYHVGVDGISLFLILLTTLSVPIVILSSFKYITESEKFYYMMVLFLEIAMLGTFLALDLVLFFLFWEAMLIPMYFIIAIWGGDNKRYATFKFVIYTSIGSVLMLIGIFYVGNLAGSFSINDVYGTVFSIKEQLLLFGAFFLAFAIKVPIFPFHTWLPDAHVEAPTGGSVILAAILLKMGAYGVIRFVIPLFPNAVVLLAPLIFVLAVVGIIYAAMASYVQKDLKRLVAYSSVSHMGLIILGLFALSSVSISGAVYQMISHGLSTGSLFLIVGILYERRHTRLITEYGGIASAMPMFSVFFMIASLTSIAVPFTSGFVGEFMVLFGAYSSDFLKNVYEYSQIFVYVAASGMLFGAIYMLWAYQKVALGPNINLENQRLFDLSLREFIVLLPYSILMIVLGIHTEFVVSRIMPSVDRIIGIFYAGLR
ncbi:MAG: NADH-quinone oxidoreductase subunit M [Deltaproteobacteria bacterium]|nr:NADH-quinone oxidoreductase subunit M [Deltaproteobacteria bacterium]